MTDHDDIYPFSVNAQPWLDVAAQANVADVQRAIASESPGVREFARLISDAAESHVEPMAQRAQQLTRRHFGRTISLYVPLYLSNYCTGGCLYCGFSSDHPQPRSRLERDEVQKEIETLEASGFQNVLLLTGERTPQADFEYLRDCVALASRSIHNVTVEAFAMTTDEYRILADAGCTGITLYQETYDPTLYAELHRWGEKRDYRFRFAAPERALAAGLRTVGMGVLLGLREPRADLICLFAHVRHLMKHYWQGGISVSFPRICPQLGQFTPRYVVSDAFLAQVIFAFRLCLPEVHLVLSTREKPVFRDGMAGVGISRMSVASRTTVGGYHHGSQTGGQFDVSDTRDVDTFCKALAQKNLEPVFKNWDAVFQDISES